jgi:hypothetical protein
LCSQTGHPAAACAKGAKPPAKTHANTADPMIATQILVEAPLL